MAESEKELKSLLMRVKEDSEKAGLKLNIKNLRSWDSVPSLHGKQEGKRWKQSDFPFLGSKITVESDLSHEIRRQLFPRKDITLLTKAHLVKAMVFPVVTYRCESWTMKKAERRRIDVFKLWCWRRLLRVLWQQGDQTGQSSRKSTLNIHWKDWCWNRSSSTLATWCKQLTH